ncbi:MAG: hypothetical protein AB2809_12110 [Candidatus Thiodiazotropha sp.]
MEILRQQKGPDLDDIAVLINQFQDNNQEMAGEDSTETLASLAEQAFGSSYLKKHHTKNLI